MSRTPTGAAVLRPELTEAVVAATMGELAEQGYGRLSMQRVAARAGVGKSALYRRWPGKQEMVLDVLGRLGVPTGDPPDTGTLRGDLRALLEEIRTWMTAPGRDGIWPDLLAEARRAPGFGAGFRERLAEPRRAWGRAVVERAVARGEIPEPDVELVLDVIGATPAWRLLVHGAATIEDGYLDRLADLLATGLGAAPAPG